MLPNFGIHTAVVTPFDEDDSLDLDGFRALCERQVVAGVHGLVVCGTTGESPTLSADERASMGRAAIEVADGKAAVTMGVGSNDTASTLRRVEEAAEMGADCGLLVLPYYNRPNPAGLIHHVKAALSVGLPLMVYHVPGRTGQNVGVATLAEIAGLDGVVAIKEATGDVQFGTSLIAATPTPVLSGDDFTFLGLQAQGGRGCVSVVSNVAPSQTVAIYDAWRESRLADATDGFGRLYELVTFLFSDTNPVPCKAALAALGLCKTHVRLPLSAWAGPLPTEVVERALG